jgi:hypothetical protein
MLQRGDYIETGFGKRKNTLLKMRAYSDGFFPQSLQFKNLEIRHGIKSFAIPSEKRKRESKTNIQKSA